MESFGSHKVEAGLVIGQQEARKIKLDSEFETIVQGALDRARSICQSRGTDCHIRRQVIRDRYDETTTVTYSCASVDDGEQCSMPNGPYLACDTAANSIMAMQQHLSDGAVRPPEQ